MPPRHTATASAPSAQSAAAAAAAARVDAARRRAAHRRAARRGDPGRLLRHRAAAAVVEALEPAAGETPVLLRSHACAPPAAAADVQWRCWAAVAEVAHAGRGGRRAVARTIAALRVCAAGRRHV